MVLVVVPLGNIGDFWEGEWAAELQDALATRDGTEELILSVSAAYALIHLLEGTRLTFISAAQRPWRRAVFALDPFSSVRKSLNILIF